MLSRKLLLITLFTSMSLAGLLAQNTVHVHGTVTDANGNLRDSINILLSVLYSDSTGVVESVYTDANGTYEFNFDGPPPNLLAFVQVSMVDCFGNLITQNFTIFNGPSDLQADFNYCEQIVIDSCLVYILEEWNPGSLPGLTAWTYANVPVEYQWSTGETTQSIYPNQTGEYCVDVTFPWGCTGSDCYQFSLDSFGNCFTYIATLINNDGTYFLEAVAYGVPAFEYLWNTGASSQQIDNVGPGTYCVTVTDATGCTYEACVILDDFDFCEVYIYEDPIVGGLTAQGYGQDPLSYIWSTGDSSQTIYPIEPGLYCVTMVDDAGCQSYSCYDYGFFPDTCYVYIQPVYLDTNTLGLQAVSGTVTQTVSYLWSTGDTVDIIIPTDFSQTYCVTITDTNGCVASACFDNSQFCYAWIDLNYVDTTTAILSVLSDPIFGFPGSDTATYVWSNGATDPIITVIENGQYCVTATLGNSCTAEACVYVDFDSLRISCSAWVYQYQDPATNQWYAEVYAWGFGNFSYLWSNGDTNTVTAISTPNEFVCVTATSSFGCVAEACVDTTFSPCQVYIDASYFTNGAVLKATSWYGGAVNNGIFTWGNGQTGDILTVSEEGTYCVTFVSVDGCTSEACIDVFFWNADSCGVWIAVEPNPFGTLFTANAWGVPPFSYLWSNGSTDQSQVIDFGPLDLCVTVTDSIGCVSYACTFPDSTVEGNDVISGFVFADTAVLVQGHVYAYLLEANSGTSYSLIDSATIDAKSWYQFNPLPAGAYILKAVLYPGTVGASDYLPTYHLSGATWEEATPHVLPNWLTVTTDIWMRRADGSNGSGVIGGSVTDPNHIVAGTNEEVRGSGLANVEVLLMNEQGQPIMYTISDENGGFRFTGLAFGTYRISYDIPGLYSPEIWVTLTPEDPERLQVTLVVNTGSVSVEQPEIKELALYPNPAKNEINIMMPDNNSTYDIQILDMQGRVVYAGSGKSNNSIMPVNVGQLSPGLFHINLKGENEFFYSRFLKLE